MLTEKHWQSYSAVTSVLAILVSVYCLSEHITGIFVHLYYIPIIILSYRYRERGVLCSLFLVMVYLLLVFFYFPDDMHVIIEGIIRGVALMAISFIVSALASRIQIHVDALQMEIQEHEKTEAALRQSESRYMELSIKDDLTGLYNQRHFYHLLQAEIERSERYVRPLSLLLIDIDDFKQFNDTYGHMEGDRVLERIGATILRCIRRTDLAFRYGGEEFTVCMPETMRDHAGVLAERIRMEFREERFRPFPGKEELKTVSIGIAQYRPGEELKDFIARADRNMYEAKRRGKDRVHNEPQEAEPAS
ncbi:MAG TPA: GGDEF domain-containing protein [Syntrophales bacterium]|nr:GGDEF domain-containing protein [Syntrophales bacterium]